MLVVAEVARDISMDGTSTHRGWEADDALVNGDSFKFFFSGTGTTRLIGLGAGLGPGTFFQYTSYFKYAIERVSSTSINVWTDGVSASVSGTNLTSGWWSILRSGNDYVIQHKNDIVHTITDAASYKVGAQTFIGSGDTLHTVHVDWAVSAHHTGTISDGDSRNELVTTGGSTTHNPFRSRAFGG